MTRAAAELCAQMNVLQQRSEYLCSAARCMHKQHRAQKLPQLLMYTDSIGLVHYRVAGEAPSRYVLKGVMLGNYTHACGEECH